MLLTSKEVAAILAVSDQTIRNLSSRGVLPCVSINTETKKRARTIYRFDKEKILNFIDSHSNPDNIAKP